jgi:hypothetical protein
LGEATDEGCAQPGRRDRRSPPAEDPSSLVAPTKAAPGPRPDQRNALVPTDGPPAAPERSRPTGRPPRRRRPPPRTTLERPPRERYARLFWSRRPCLTRSARAPPPLTSTIFARGLVVGGRATVEPTRNPAP